MSRLTVGVIIGRFQVPSLHKGHKALIRKVRAENNICIVLLGATPSLPSTTRQPLSFEVRKKMFDKEGLFVYKIMDNPTDEGWSEQVDRTLECYFPNTDYVEGARSYDFTLYGSRDSFISHYKGKHRVVEVAPVKSKSGTELRSAVAIEDSTAFRKGIIYAANQRYPTMFCTVDVIIRNSFNSHILLGRKKNDPVGKWRFPGGFLDPTKDQSFLDAAKREADEEVKGLTYQEWYWNHCGSLLVDDWRYRREQDKIMTTVFTARATSLGLPTAGDDLDMVQWFEPSQLPEVLINEHKPIWTTFGQKY